MADTWPPTDNLGLEGKHLVWKFGQGDPDFVSFVVGYEACEAQTVDIHISYVPALASFDIEYWRVMLLPQLSRHHNIPSRLQMEQKYMQSLRLAISEEIFVRETAQLRYGLWEMAIIHEWCIRTWNNYSHSDFGRAEYVKKCSMQNIVPYAQQLTEKSERFYLAILFLVSTFNRVH
jgi:hypothetical protein